MKKAIIRSLICAIAIEMIGAITNLISYFTRGKFLISQVLYGGECQVWRGFGLALTEIYPLIPRETYEIYSRISFDYASLHVTIVAGFVLSFVVFCIINTFKKRNTCKK